MFNLVIMTLRSVSVYKAALDEMDILVATICITQNVRHKPT